MSAADGTSRAGVDGTPTPPPEPSGPLFTRLLECVTRGAESDSRCRLLPSSTTLTAKRSCRSVGGPLSAGTQESLAEGSFDAAKQLTVGEEERPGVGRHRRRVQRIGDKHPDSGVTGGMSSEPGASIDPKRWGPKSTLDNEPNYSTDPGLSGTAAQPPGWFPPMADPNVASAPGSLDAPSDPGIRSIDPGASFDPGMSLDPTQTGPIGPAPIQPHLTRGCPRRSRARAQAPCPRFRGRPNQQSQWTPSGRWTAAHPTRSAGAPILQPALIRARHRYAAAGSTISARPRTAHSTRHPLRLCRRTPTPPTPNPPTFQP